MSADLTDRRIYNVEQLVAEAEQAFKDSELDHWEGACKEAAFIVCRMFRDGDLMRLPRAVLLALISVAGEGEDCLEEVPS